VSCFTLHLCLFSPNSPQRNSEALITLTLSCKVVFSPSDAATLSLRSDASGEPLNLLRGDRRSAGTKYKTGGTSVAAGGEVVEDLYLLRDGLTDDDGGDVLKDDDDDSDDDPEDDDDNSARSNEYQVDNGATLHQSMAAL
ncbi:hypothetical protein Tco_1268763, partial [Tanacetum coccineum]